MTVAAVSWMTDRFDLLRENREKVRELFKRSEEARGRWEKGRLYQEALEELQREEARLKALMKEVREDRHVLDVLMAELQDLEPSYESSRRIY